MKAKLLSAAAIAALALGDIAYAQSVDYDYYVTGSGDKRLVVARGGGEGVEVLPSENGVRPQDCVAGGFYSGANNTIVSCDDDMAFNLIEPPEGFVFDNPPPAGQTAFLMQPQESGDVKDGGAPAATGSINQNNNGSTQQ
jgi:hypothetical protein